VRRSWFRDVAGCLFYCVVAVSILWRRKRPHTPLL
jgi:hypothetical protein